MNKEQFQMILFIGVIVLVVALVAVTIFYISENKKAKKQSKKNAELPENNTLQTKKEDQYNGPTDFNIMDKTAQEFLPFDDIDSSMICLPNGEYRMVVEVGSMNYYLKTDEEQEVIEGMFRNAISSWDFPYMFYTQTREIDNDEIIENLQKDIEVYTSKFPKLFKYGHNYVEEMRNMGLDSGNNLTKRHFIIVSCNDAKNIKANKTEDDLRDFAFDKLSLAVQKVYEGLGTMGLQMHCLNNIELYDLLLSAINKGESVKDKSISNFMSFVVNGDESLNNKPQEEKIGLLFEGFETQLKNQILSYHDYSSDDFVKAQKLLNEFERLRKEVVENEFDNDEGYFDLSI